MTILFESRRHFTVWKYLVSHGQLLLRSVPSDREHKRIEVLFRNVSAMNTIMELDCLTIREPSEAELVAIDERIGHRVPRLMETTFVLETLTTKGYIIASEFATVEEEGDYKTPSSLLIEGPSP